MPNLRMIRRRITAVQNIQQVTRAMRMIAASRLRRAQEGIEQTRPYADQLTEFIRHLAAQVDQESHPLLEEREVKKATIIVIAGDRGLCRGFNANAFRKAIHRSEELATQGVATDFIVLGKKTVDFFRRRRLPVVEAFPGIFQHLDFATATAVARLATERFLNGETDLVEVIYNEFVSVLRQNLVARQYLPLKATPDESEESANEYDDYIYEPDQEYIWRALLDKYLNFAVWRMLLESNAAEQAARMTAMEEATNNAEEMIKNLISVRNKVRQTSITTELTEIVGSAESLRAD
jgi:F-type H+-transporting ATPase subunit gamma